LIAGSFAGYCSRLVPEGCCCGFLFWHSNGHGVGMNGFAPGSLPYDAAEACCCTMWCLFLIKARSMGMQLRLLACPHQQACADVHAVRGVVGKNHARMQILPECVCAYGFVCVCVCACRRAQGCVLVLPALPLISHSRKWQTMRNARFLLLWHSVARDKQQ